MSDWRETEFGELIDVINGFAFKSANFLGNKVNGSLPVIKIKNVANGNAHLNGVQYHEYSENLSKYLVTKGDVLIALTGNHPQAETQVVGLASRYKLDCRALLNQRVAKIVSKNEEILCADYVYYFLKDTNTHLYLASQSSGSANQANISKSDIENIPFSLPPEKEQKTIAAVLSSLDDQIDLLHHQNKTLEAMAETLFRQWFIEEAQEDWREYAISDFAEHIKINVIPSKNADTLFHHYSLPAYDSEQKPAIELGSEILSNKYKVLENSILVSKLNPRFPRIWAITTLQNQAAICSTEFQVFKPKNENLFGYLYFLLRSNEVTDELMAASGN